MQDRIRREFRPFAGRQSPMSTFMSDVSLDPAGRDPSPAVPFLSPAGFAVTVGVAPVGHGLNGIPNADDPWRLPAAMPVCSDDDEDAEDEDLGDEEDLAVSQPLADEESSFDDFDDEFDDDFEEEENDPDWDHPDDTDEEPPPGKPPGKKK